MANNVNIKVTVDDAALEKLTNKAQQSAKIIRGGFDIATGAAAIFGTKSAEAMEKLANRSILVANSFNGLEDLIEGLGKQEGFLKAAQKVGIGKQAVEGFAAALPGIGIAAAVVLPLVTEYWDDIASAIGISTEQTLLNSEAIGKAAEKFTSLKTDVEVLVSEYNNSNTSLERQKEIVGELSEISPNYFNTAISNTEQLKAAQDQFNAAIIQQITLESSKSLIAEKQKEFLNENVQLLQDIAALEARDPKKFPALNEAQREADRKNADRLKELRSQFKENERLFQGEVTGLLNIATKASGNLDKLGGDVTKKAIKGVAKTAKETAREELDLPLLQTLILGEGTLEEPLPEEDKKKLANAISLSLLGVTEEVRQQQKEDNKPSPLVDLIIPTEQEITELDLTIGERAQFIGKKIEKFLNSEAFQQSFAVFNNITSAIYDNLQMRLDALSTEKEKALAMIDDFEKQALEKANDNELERVRIQKDANAKRLKAEEEYAAKEKELRKKQADIQLAVTIAQILATQAKAITEAIAVAPPLGFILAGLVGTATAIQLSTAIQQRNQIAKLAQGGTLFGPSHAEGGIRGTGAFGGIEVEGGEMIINKRSARMYGPLLSRINQAGGGVPLIPTKAANGGVLPGSMMSDLDYDRLASAIAATPVRAYVVTQDITDSQDKLNLIQRKANLF